MYGRIGIERNYKETTITQSYEVQEIVERHECSHPNVIRRIKVFRQLVEEVQNNVSLNGIFRCYDCIQLREQMTTRYINKACILLIHPLFGILCRYCPVYVIIYCILAIFCFKLSKSKYIGCCNLIFRYFISLIVAVSLWILQRQHVHTSLLFCLLSSLHSAQVK